MIFLKTLNLPEGSNRQEIFNHLDPSAVSMEQVNPHSNLWKVQLDSPSLENLPFILKKITTYHAAGLGEPDRIPSLQGKIKAERLNVSKVLKWM